MNRRGFLGMLVGGVAVASAECTWPFRVFSFPTEVKPAAGYSTYILGKDAFLLPPGLSSIWYDRQALDALKEALDFTPEKVQVMRGYVHPKYYAKLGLVSRAK